MRFWLERLRRLQHQHDGPNRAGWSQQKEKKEIKREGVEIRVHPRLQSERTSTGEHVDGGDVKGQGFGRR